MPKKGDLSAIRLKSGKKVRGERERIIKFADWLASLPFGVHKLTDAHSVNYAALLLDWTNYANETMLHPQGRNALLTRRSNSQDGAYVKWIVQPGTGGADGRGRGQHIRLGRPPNQR